MIFERTLGGTAESRTRPFVDQVGGKARRYAECLSINRCTHFYREDFAGILKDEYLPDWAREKLNELQPEESESPGMMM